MEDVAIKSKKLHFVVEENIPYIEGVLESYGTVEYLPSLAITHSVAERADALLVRTRTRCDEKLLHDTSVRLVATATIGTDHIDKDWCAAHGVRVANAPGCNAPAVAQYVLSTVAHLINRHIGEYRIGIVGVGHVGSIVEKWARSMGMRVMLCDPPRQRVEGGDQWHSLEEIAEHCDIITLHTPLTTTGADATYHLADASFFDSCRRAPIFINAARGPVVDTPALIEAIRTGKVHHAVVDTWEGEPRISRELMDLCDIATPHIAGYSLHGKMRATRMVLDAVSETFGLPHLTFPGEHPMPVAPRVNVPILLNTYNPFQDDYMLRANPDDFEELRDNYPLRPEP